jgi:hypothetical protein
MKKFLVVAAVAVFLLSGCAAGTASDASRSTSAGVNTNTPNPLVTPDPVATKAVDPNVGSGASPGDGAGDTLQRTTVPWGDYAAGTQADIDALTAAADCKSLDSQRGSAIANEESVRASSGHGSEALLKYIDEARALAGCN